jgi:small subunit ribosomal protein S20
MATSRTVNRARKATLKSAGKKIQGLLEEQNKAEAATAVKELQSKLDKASQRGTIHKNKASRKKSRMMKALNKLAKAKAETK